MMFIDLHYIDEEYYDEDKFIPIAMTVNINEIKEFHEVIGLDGEKRTQLLIDFGAPHYVKESPDEIRAKIKEAQDRELRAKFAIAALTGTLAYSNTHHQTPSIEASYSYRLADEMMKARETKND